MLKRKHAIIYRTRGVVPAGKVPKWAWFVSFSSIPGHKSSASILQQLPGIRLHFLNSHHSLTTELQHGYIQGDPITHG